MDSKIKTALQNFKTWEELRKALDPRSRATGPICYWRNGSVKRVRGLCGTALIILKEAERSGFKSSLLTCSVSYSGKWKKPVRVMLAELEMKEEFDRAVDFLLKTQ